MSLLIGTSITLLIALARAGRILPESAEVVLRPGAWVAWKTHANDMAGALVAAVSDGVVLGAIPFLLMCVFRRKPEQPRGAASQFSRTPLVDRRRSKRERLAAKVFVYGYLRDEPFAETTETLNVSENGGLMMLSVRPLASQELVLVNTDTDEELRCRVARSVVDGDKAATGVEFLRPSATFWHPELVAAKSA